MKEFKYCTTNLDKAIYKIFTCPGSENCPADNPKTVILTEFDKEVKVI